MQKIPLFLEIATEDDEVWRENKGWEEEENIMHVAYSRKK